MSLGLLKLSSPAGHKVCSIGELVGRSIAHYVDGHAVRKVITRVQASGRSLSQFRAFTCFVLADCAAGLIEIDFLLLTIIYVTSESSSGVAIANGVDGNAVRKEGVGVQAADSVVEPVTCIHLLCTRRLRRWPCRNQFPPIVHNICNFRELVFDVSACLSCTSTRLARVPIFSLASSPLHFSWPVTGGSLARVPLARLGLWPLHVLCHRWAR